MDKTEDQFQFKPSNANAESPNFESAQATLQPPAFQLKTQEQNQESQEVEQVSDQPYQLAAEGIDPPPNDAGSNDDPAAFKPNNTGLPTQLKSGVENLSGFSLDDVKVHYNSDKPAQLSAHAYAQGSDIHVASGQEKHLPHEAWHVVQQKQGRVQPTKQLKGVGVNDDSGLEKEADVMGAKANFQNVQLKGNSVKSNNGGTKGIPVQKKDLGIIQMMPDRATWETRSSLKNRRNDGEKRSTALIEVDKAVEAYNEGLPREKQHEKLDSITFRIKKWKESKGNDPESKKRWTHLEWLLAQVKAKKDQLYAASQAEGEAEQAIKTAARNNAIKAKFGEHDIDTRIENEDARADYIFDKFMNIFRGKIKYAPKTDGESVFTAGTAFACGTLAKDLADAFKAYGLVAKQVRMGGIEAFLTKKLDVDYIDTTSIGNVRTEGGTLEETKKWFFAEHYITKVNGGTKYYCPTTGKRLASISGDELVEKTGFVRSIGGTVDNITIKPDPANQGNYIISEGTKQGGSVQGKFHNKPASYPIYQLKTNTQDNSNLKLKNTGLPNQLKSDVENLSGYSLDDVKVHYNSDKPAQLQAHAYAQGTDIHVASGQERHLPHEAWHVVQQKQGRVQPTTQLKAFNINDDAGLEKEADVMGAKAISTGYIIDKELETEGALSNKNDAFQSKMQSGTSVVAQAKFEVEKDYAKKLLNRSSKMVFNGIMASGAGGSINEFERIAELISILFPFDQERLEYTEGDETRELNEVEVLRLVKIKVESKFSDHWIERVYLKSLLTSENSTPVGEPSKIARALLAAGLIGPISMNADLDYVIALIEGSEKKELIPFEIYIDSFLKLLEVRTNFTTFPGPTGKAKLAYLEQLLKNKADTDLGDQYHDPTGEKQAKAKDREGLLLLKTMLSKLDNNGKKLKEPSNVAKIREWANDLQEHERKFILTNNESEIHRFIKSIDEEYQSYLLKLFESKSFKTDDASQAEDSKKQEADMILERLKSKEQTKSKHIESIISLVAASSKDVRQSVMSKLVGHAVDDNPENRAQAISFLKAKLRKPPYNIKEDEVERFANLFSWGSSAGSEIKDGLIYKFQKKLNSGYDYSMLVKLKELVLKMSPEDLTHLRRNKEVLDRLKVIKDYIKPNAPYDVMQWNALTRMINIPSNYQVGTSEKDDVEQSVEAYKLSTHFWAKKIEGAIRERVANDDISVHRNKGKVLSLVRQAINAGTVAVSKKGNDIDDLSEFTREVWHNIGQHAKQWLSYGKMSKAKDALMNGEQLLITDTIDMIKVKNPIKHLTNHAIKTSSIKEIIGTSSGDQLLHEISDFNELKIELDKIKAEHPNDPEHVKLLQATLIATYVPDVRTDIFEKLRDSLPADDFATLHKDLILQMSQALENEGEFRSALETLELDDDNIDLRREMMISLGLLSREQIVDTGWQMKWFTAKGPTRKEARRILMHRLRKAQKTLDPATESISDPLPDLKEKLDDANANMEERTEEFLAAKDKAIKGIMLTVSIIVGVITTVGSMGLAAAFAAAGVSAAAAAYATALIFTFVSSLGKFALENALTGGSYNTAEGGLEVLKSVFLAAATVAAGQAGEQVMGLFNKMGGLKELFNAVDGGTASVGQKLLYAFVEKIIAVSPIEVLFRNITEEAFLQLTESEREERFKLSIKEIKGALKRYFVDFTVDAGLKTIMDMMTTDMFGEWINGESFQTMSDGQRKESILPVLSALSPGQLATIIIAENIITSQNFSVAEQDSVFGNLVVDAASDKIKDYTVIEDTENKISTVEGVLTLKERIQRVPKGLLIERFIEPEQYVEIYKSAGETRLLADLTFGEDKRKELLLAFKKARISYREAKEHFGVSDGTMIDVMYPKHRNRKHKERHRHRRDRERRIRDLQVMPQNPLMSAPSPALAQEDDQEEDAALMNLPDVPQHIPGGISVDEGNEHVGENRQAVQGKFYTKRLKSVNSGDFSKDYAMNASKEQIKEQSRNGKAIKPFSLRDKRKDKAD